MYFIHHIFLPPKLPQKDDFNAEYETALLDTTIDTLQKFKGCTKCDYGAAIDSVINMLFNMSTVRDFQGTVNEKNLENSLKVLCRKGNVALHGSLEFSNEFETV